MDDELDGVMVSDALSPPQSVASGPKLPKQKPKAKKKRRAAKRFKVTRFDKDLVKLIHAGTTDLKEVCRELGVDYDQARSRALLMAEKQFLVTDPSHPDVFRLGLEGYNKFASLLSPKPTKKARESASPALAPEASVPAPQPIENVDAMPKAHTSVDLADLLRRGAPVSKPDASKDAGSVSVQPSALSSALPPVTQKGTVESVACELCRAPFKLSVKNTAEAKYAHCFCGAAYHKDCYHALVEGGGRCARCGRKLSLILDRHADEALKSVKDLFD